MKKFAVIGSPISHSLSPQIHSLFAEQADIQISYEYDYGVRRNPSINKLVEKNYYKFRWIVEKYEAEGPLKDCWLTTGVSQPVSLGSSI